MPLETNEQKDARLAGRYTINELSTLYGVTYRALRLYEERELLRPLRLGAARYYSEQDRIRLGLVLTGKKLGFTLATIWELIESRLGTATPSDSTFFKALNKAEIEEQLTRLKRQRATIDDAIAKLRQVQNEAQA